MNIDLDAAKAARREANGEVPQIIFDGKTFNLPVELPFEVAEAVAEIQKDPQAIMRAIEVFLGEQTEEFLASHPSMNDIQALVEGMGKVYGFADLGESSASSDSS